MCDSRTVREALLQIRLDFTPIIADYAEIDERILRAVVEGVGDLTHEEAKEVANAIGRMEFDLEDAAKVASGERLPAWMAGIEKNSP
jgi:hypothetical protein